MELDHFPQSIAEARKIASVMLRDARKKALDDRKRSDEAARKEAKELFAFPPQKEKLDALWHKSMSDRRGSLENEAAEHRATLIDFFEQEIRNV